MRRLHAPHFQRNSWPIAFISLDNPRFRWTSERTAGIYQAPIQSWVRLPLAAGCIADTKTVPLHSAGAHLQKVGHIYTLSNYLLRLLTGITVS